MLSVVWFPMLLDKPADVGAVIAASTRAVAKNPVTMAVGGLIIALASGPGAPTVFVELVAFIKVLARAGWPLFRRETRA